MKIAQVSPLIESVPPKLYGGTERIVSYLTEELVRQGHEVTLFASGDSETAAELVPCVPEALRLAQVDDPAALQRAAARENPPTRRRFRRRAFSRRFLHFPLARSLGTPSVTTLHGRLDLPFYRPLLDEFPDMPLVSISDDQRRLLPARWIATVLHGLPRDLYSFSAGDGGYLAFLGRISPEKRPDRAIEIAKRAGVKLKIAAKVDKVDENYFNERSVRSSKAPESNTLAKSTTARSRRSSAGLGAAVSDRLARTVRSRPDRGDGLRNSGYRLAPRLRAGGDRAGRQRLYGRGNRRGGRGGPQHGSLSRESVRERFEQRFHHRARGPRLRAGVRSLSSRTHPACLAAAGGLVRSSTRARSAAVEGADNALLPPGSRPGRRNMG